jgi:hypothetical protein
MHYHAEVILPANVNAAGIPDLITDLLSEYNENNSEGCNQFFDWLVVGGRWAGTKLEATLDKQKLEAFKERLMEMEVKVHGVVAGKQSLLPEFIEPVDKLWREMFPDAGQHCTLFEHANDKYDSTSLISGDICTLDKLPLDFTAARVIFAAPIDGEWRITGMYVREIWNGECHQKTEWDGRIMSAVAAFDQHIANYKDSYKAQISIENLQDWIAVTIDYHS